MATPESDSFSHSTMLFTTAEGNGMMFRMRPSTTRSRLIKAIKHGGGGVTNNTSEDCIPVLAEGDKAYSDDSIEARYIDDCIAQNTLLDMEPYRVKAKKNRSDGTGDSSPGTSIISTSSTVKGRSKYTEEEDEAILKYIAANPNQYRGNAIWKKMETMQITSHPWQSMRDRFGKKLEGRLADYITKYKTGVLKKYCLKISSDTSTEGEQSNRDDDKPSESTGTGHKSKNKNNNNHQEEEVVQDMELGSNDSFDESLLESAHDTEKQKPLKSRHSKTADTHRQNGVEAEMDSDAVNNDDQNGRQDEMEQSSDEKQNEKSGMTTRSVNQDEVKVQCSRVTRSHQATSSPEKVISSPEKPNRTMPKRKTTNNKESEVKNPPNTRAKRKFKANEKTTNKENYSSHDAEGEETGDDLGAAQVKRKTRQVGHKTNIRRLRGRVIEDSSSSSEGDSSDEVEEIEDNSENQRVDKACIDKIINEKLSGRRDQEETSNDDAPNVANNSDDEETQITEVKDSLPDSQETQDTNSDPCVECLGEDVQTIQGIMSDFGLSVKAVVYAVYMNSGNVDASYHYIRTGEPPQGHYLWEKHHDVMLNSSNSADIRKLVKKFGQDEVTARQEFLDSV